MERVQNTTLKNYKTLKCMRIKEIWKSIIIIDLIVMETGILITS